jgi:hypothetical protein
MGRKGGWGNGGESVRGVAAGSAAGSSATAALASVAFGATAVKSSIRYRLGGRRKANNEGRAEVRPGQGIARHARAGLRWLGAQAGPRCARGAAESGMGWVGRSAPGHRTAAKQRQDFLTAAQRWLCMNVKKTMP